LNPIEALCYGPEFWGQSIVMIEQGVIVIVAFGILNRIIDSVAKL
jgi:hypothetical protein